jgi:hypothetical protein
MTLMKFLVAKIGFTPDNARKIFAKANVEDPTRNRPAPQAQTQQAAPKVQAPNPTQNKPMTEAIDNNSLRNVFTSAAQFAYANNLIPDDAKEVIQKQTGNFKSDNVDKRTREYRDKNNSNSSSVDQTVANLGAKASSNLDKAAEKEADQQKQDQSTTHFTLNKSEFRKQLVNMGINADQINDIIDVVHDSKSFKDMKNFMMPGIAMDEFNRRLQKIGYAFVKSQDMTGFTDIKEK